MLKIFVRIFRHTKSKATHFIRTTTNAAHISIEVEMKRLNDRKEFAAALALFDRHKYPAKPTDRVLIQALKACTQLGYLERGQIIHKTLANASLNSAYIQTTLIHFYMQCGRTTDAQRIFDSSSNKTLFHYGAMMKGWVKNGMADKAVELFSKIVNPDEVLLCLFFNSCAQVRTTEALNFGREVWLKVSSLHPKNPFIHSAVFDMFIRGGDLSNAEKVFAQIKRSVISYGHMMKCYNDHFMPKRTLSLYEAMKNEGIKADVITFVLLVGACAQIGIESRCRSIAAQIPRQILSNVQLRSALIHMWGKVGCVDEAKQVFDKIDQPNSVDYTAMINSYGLNGMGREAIDLYRRMPPEMIVDKTHVCVLNACSHSGLVDEARAIFSNIQMKNKWVYTAMVDCLSRSFFFEEAKNLIEEFEQNQSPCLPMYTSLLSGARNRQDKPLARQTIDRIQQAFSHLNEDLTGATVLLANTLAASGELDEASTVRWQMSQSAAKKQAGLSWTEVNGKIIEFRVQDRSHARTREIYEELDRLAIDLIEHGHKFDESWITRPLMHDETVQSVLNGHSERLALAFNLIQRPIPSRIQIVKNLRICGDCHAAIKLISHFRQIQIVIRDANRIHHFARGKCSCNDHF